MRKPSVAVAVLSVIFIMPLVGCSRNVAQDIDAILESELLASHGIVINRPDNPYFNFFEGEDRDALKVNVALHVLGEHGEYFFTPGGWTDERILQLVQVSEDGIRFAKNWLGSEIDTPIPFVFNITEPAPDSPLPMWGGGWALRGAVYISMAARLMPSLIVHEAVHAILQIDGRRSNFPHTPETSSRRHSPFLEEGLCDLIDFLFFMETEHLYDVNRYGRDRQAAENHLHNAALRMFRFHDNFEDEAEFGLRYPQLMSYETAASFIYFLLQRKGSVEDFMRVFEDIYLMEEVYGWGMDDMIAKWMEYLNEFRRRSQPSSAVMRFLRRAANIFDR